MKLRRMFVALLIATSGMVVGVAAAGVEARADDWSFPVPPMHIGDQGLYNRTDPGSDGETTAFIVMGEEEVFDADGDSRASVRIAMQDTSVATFWIDPEDRSTIAARVDAGGGGSGIGLGVGVVDYWRFSGYRQWHTTYGPDVAPCGLVHGLQGQVADADSPLTMQDACPAIEMQAAGTDVVSGRHTRVYEDAASGVRIHLTPGLPYPLRIEGPYSTYDLTLFGRGDAPPVSMQVSGAAAAVAFAPYEHGPDATGFDHPYLLDDAVAAALALPGSNPMRDFFDANAGAYIAEASFVERYEPGQRWRIWDVVATDGDDAASFALIQDAVDPATAVDDLAGVALVSAPGLPATRVEVTSRPLGDYPAPEARPTTLPTLASLHARWLDHAREGDIEDGADAYGFAITCTQDCTTASATAWLGINRTHAQTRSEVPYVCVFVCAAPSHVWMASQLMVDEGGRTLAFMHTEWYYAEGAGYYSGGGPSVDVQGRRIEPSPQFEPLSLEATTWGWPGTAATAGISIASIVVAILYYLWPAAKTAPMFLFSRVHKDKALEHPVRQRLHQAITTEPGIHLNGLVRAVDKKGGVVRHHLGILEANGLILSKTGGGYRCYFPAHTGRHELATAGALRSPTAQQLLQATRERPGLSMQDLAAQVGITPSAATHHARRLADAGLIERRREGRSVRIYPGARPPRPVRAA